MIYFLIFILLLVFSYIYDYKRQRRGFKVSFYLSLILLIALAGFRYRVGGDTYTYMKFFEQLHILPELKSYDFIKSRFGPGFILYASFIKTLVNDFIFFQFVHATLVNGVIFYFIKKNCKNPFFAIFIFFNFLYFYLVFEQIRESIAVIIFLLAWPFFRKGIWWKWYIASILAFMFHVSAFILFFLPLINLPYIRQIFIFGNKTWIICILVFIGAFVIQTTLFRYVELIAVTESMLDRVQVYGDMNSNERFNINLILGSFIQFIFFPLMALYFQYKQNKKGDRNDFFKFGKKEDMMVLISVYISIFSIFVGIFVRYNNYFFIFAIILMADWVYGSLPIGRKYVRLGYLYWILLFLPMLSFNFYINYLTPVNKTGTLKSYMLYYPYNSVLDPKIDQNREKTILYIHRHLK